MMSFFCWQETTCNWKRVRIPQCTPVRRTKKHDKFRDELHHDECYWAGRADTEENARFPYSLSLKTTVTLATRIVVLDCDNVTMTKPNAPVKKSFAEHLFMPTWGGWRSLLDTQVHGLFSTFAVNQHYKAHAVQKLPLSVRVSLRVMEKQTWRLNTNRIFPKSSRMPDQSCMTDDHESTYVREYWLINHGARGTCLARRAHEWRSYFCLSKSRSWFLPGHASRAPDIVGARRDWFSSENRGQSTDDGDDCLSASTANRTSWKLPHVHEWITDARCNLTNLW